MLLELPHLLRRLNVVASFGILYYRNIQPLDSPIKSGRRNWATTHGKQH